MNPPVRLRPARPGDRPHVYAWAACSDVTASMMGPPLFPDHPPPTWEEFCADYAPHFFDGSRPESGGCFIILAGDQEVGVISYDRLDPEQGHVELDLWMRSLACCGQGYGSQALRLVCDHLGSRRGVRTFVIRPSARNPRAVKAYERAGFVRRPLSPAQLAHFGPGDYHDTVDMQLDWVAESPPTVCSECGGQLQ